MSIPHTVSGDVGLSASKTWRSKTIRFFGKLQTGKATRSHVFACIGDDQIIESLTEVRVDDLAKYDGQDIEIWRPPLDDEDRIRFRRGILKMAGDGYGWFKIPLFAADSVATAITKPFTGKYVFFFTKTFGISSFKVCSHLYVYALHHFTKYRLRGPEPAHEIVNWKTISPDYLADLIAAPHNRFIKKYPF